MDFQLAAGIPCQMLVQLFCEYLTPQFANPLCSIYANLIQVISPIVQQIHNIYYISLRIIRSSYKTGLTKGSTKAIHRPLHMTEAPTATALTHPLRWLGDISPETAVRRRATHGDGELGVPPSVVTRRDGEFHGDHWSWIVMVVN